MCERRAFAAGMVADARVVHGNARTMSWFLFSMNLETVDDTYCKQLVLSVFIKLRSNAK